MGTHRRSKAKSTAHSRIAAVTIAAGALSLIPSPGQAEPKPSVDVVRQQVDKLYEQAEAATEQYDGILAQEKTVQAQAEQASRRVARQQEDINRLRDEIGPLAAAQYRNGGIDPTMQLMLSSNPDAFLGQAEMVDRVSGRQASVLSELEAKQRQVAVERAAATQKLIAVEQKRRDLSAKKTEVQGKLAQARSLLNSLTAKGRAKLKAQEKAQSKALGNSDKPANYTGPASGRARSALDFAYAQLGKPYQWGATGPSSFDCSGLTGGAWRAAGVSLPRTSQDQYGSGRQVAQSDLQPGDLVFFYSDIHHVGIYIGGGKMIHAPRTGKNVEIAGISTMPYAGAVRP